MKKRVKKNIKKIEKRNIKKRNKKFLIDKKYWILIIAVIIALTLLTIIFYPVITGNAVGTGDQPSWMPDWFYNAKFVPDWFRSTLSNYVIPEEQNLTSFAGQFENPSLLFLVTIIGLIVFASIVYEMVFLLPLNKYTNFIIGSGALIIIIATKLMRGIITAVMLWLGFAVSVGGTFGMIMIGIIFIVIAIASFTGATWAHEWLDKVKYNKQLQSRSSKAYKAAANVSALNTEASSVKYR